MRSQDQVRRHPNVGDYRCRNLKLCPMLGTVSGKNVNAHRSHAVSEFDVRGVVANDKGPRQVDFVIALRNPEKIGIWLHALAAVSSLVRTTVDCSNRCPRLGKALHDVIVDSDSLLSADLSLGNPALIGHDKQNEIAKAAQS